jgi:glycyl-radical enzyme activating protein
MSNKAIIFDIQRSSVHDGPGIRTTVFFKGCPLDCLWCHNPESHARSQQLFYLYDKCTQCGKCVQVCESNVHQLNNGTHTINYNTCKHCGKCVEECNSSALKIVGTEMSVDEIMDIVIADIDFYKSSNGGISLSGGEPLQHFSFLLELLESCKETGINTCLETSGFTSSEKFNEILPYLDTLLFDYKITGSEEHKRHTGVSNELILSNLDLAYNSGTAIILRCPIIQGINDTQVHFSGIRALDEKYPNLKGIELLPYHTIGNSKRSSMGIDITLPNLKTTPKELSANWLGQLREMKCTKVKIAWD